MAHRPSVKDQIGRILELGGPLEQPEREFAVWHGGERSPDGTISWPYPEYHPDVDDFFEAVQDEWWRDPSYESGRCGELIQSDAYIAAATLSEIKALLTYCARGERFCDGHREALLKSGRIAAILRRLRVLQNSSPHP